MLYIYYNKSEYIHLSFIQYIIYKFHFIYLSSNKYIQGLSFIHSLECVHQCTRYHEDVKKNNNGTTAECVSVNVFMLKPKSYDLTNLTDANRWNYPSREETSSFTCWDWSVILWKMR